MNRILFTLLFLPLFTKAQIITTIAGTGTAGFSGDFGPPASAELNSPTALCFGGFGAYGSLYLADGSNNRVRQIKLGTGGMIFTIAGTGAVGFSGDGGAAVSAEINNPAGIAALSSNVVYFSDINNNRIRKMAPSGIISTYGGTGVAGSTGDGGPATSANINSPYDVSIDKYGNIYFAELYGHRVRKIDTSGIITTVAGNGINGLSGDGGAATSAKLSFPNYSHVDTLGQLYICDNGNHRIRKVDTNGIITTVAGTGPGFGGDGGPATNAMLYYPADITVDRRGNLIISDSYNNRIRIVDHVTGIITTMAGTGTAGLSGDGGPATAAMINKPHGLATDPANNIYFIDRFNNKIRMISGVLEASFSGAASAVCQDSCITLTSTSTGVVDSVRWVAAGANISLPTAYTTPVCFTSSGIITVHLYVYGPGGVDSSSVDITVSPCATTTGIDNHKGVAGDFWLSQGATDVVTLNSSQPLDDALSVAVFDIMGRKVLDETWNKGAGSKQIWGINTGAGLYVVRLSNRSTSVALKWWKYE